MTIEDRLQRLYDELGAVRCIAEIAATVVEATVIDDELYSIFVTYSLRSTNNFQDCDDPTEEALRRAGFDWEFDGTQMSVRGPPFYRVLFFYLPGSEGEKLAAIRDEDESRTRTIEKTLKSQPPRDVVQLRDGVQRARRRAVH